MFRPIGPNAEAAALAHPDRFAFLIRVHPFDPGLDGWAAVLAASPHLKALRTVVFGDREIAAFKEGGFDPAVRRGAPARPADIRDLPAPGCPIWPHTPGSFPTCNS